MDRRRSNGERIVEAVNQKPGCLLDELLAICPDLTWSQVFTAVDHLSRNGELSLCQKGRGEYAVWPPRAKRLSSRCSVENEAWAKV